ncbi:NAD(P)-dependent oxidoreductase [Candidatus Gottesmanbacteria bacterium]|nr:NAD(P)-dependent oxidoreductase [Candidatus Gottesmanbacteria bacterium]
MEKKILITGGTGFIGSNLALVLVQKGFSVRILDNNSRGNENRIKKIFHEIEYVNADIRDESKVLSVCQNIDCVIHLASINGTEFFYTRPDEVLEISVMGMMNLLKGCIKHNIPEFFSASSSEVYNSSSIIPTPENVPLVIPDIYNPRFSYSGGKIISELLGIHYGKKYFQRMVIFRPHNVYGPDMGREHVIPQFVLRMLSLLRKEKTLISFPIQGTGKERRAFIYISDAVAAIVKLIEKANHLEIYNIGTQEEITVRQIAEFIGQYFQRKIKIVQGKLPQGSVKRRCPDISKMIALGFIPKVSFTKGIHTVIEWYVHHEK